MSQNSHSTASGDTSLREEKGLGGNFKGVTKFTQYSTASRDTSLREEIGLGGKLRGVTKFTQYSTASGDTSLREEIGLGWKFKSVTKFTQYCQRRHKIERRNKPRKEVLGLSQNSQTRYTRNYTRNNKFKLKGHRM